MAFNLGGLTAAEFCLGVGLPGSLQRKDLPFINVIIFLDDLKADDEDGYNFLLAEEKSLEITFLLVEDEVRNFDFDLCKS